MKMKISKKQVRKQLDVNIINEDTIREFIEYLGLTPEDTEWDVAQKLNNTMLAKRSTTIKDK
jgi:Trm5-related predicted tRNA methylase